MYKKIVYTIALIFCCFNVGAMSTLLYTSQPDKAWVAWLILAVNSVVGIFMYRLALKQ